MSSKIAVLDIPSTLQRHIASAHAGNPDSVIINDGWNQDNFAVLSMSNV